VPEQAVLADFADRGANHVDRCAVWFSAQDSIVAARQAPTGCDTASIVVLEAFDDLEIHILYLGLKADYASRETMSLPPEVITKSSATKASIACGFCGRCQTSRQNRSTIATLSAWTF
jgi:hypothetical protein